LLPRGAVHGQLHATGLGLKEDARTCAEPVDVVGEPVVLPEDVAGDARDEPGGGAVGREEERRLQAGIDGAVEDDVRLGQQHLRPEHDRHDHVQRHVQLERARNRLQEKVGIADHAVARVGMLHRMQSRAYVCVLKLFNRLSGIVLPARHNAIFLARTCTHNTYPDDVFVAEQIGPPTVDDVVDITEKVFAVLAVLGHASVGEQKVEVGFLTRKQNEYTVFFLFFF